MSDIVIKAENLGKKYTIGHQTDNGRYKTLRDELTHNARNLWHKTKDLTQGKSIIVGDEQEDFWALKDINFEIKQGETVGIIGRNGAGKSTLLKVLSRITEPSTGRVTIKGRVASLLEVGTGFHPELTGRENIYLNGAILGMSRAEIKRKFDEIVAFAETEKFLDTPVKRYSSGMYVRLAFAVAAHLEPEILIVDEVLAVGDAQFQKKCLGKMGDVAKEGRTVLFVSHNMAAIEHLCSRAILLGNGQIQSSGNVDNVIDLYLSSLSIVTSTTNDVLASSKDGLLELLFIGPADISGQPQSIVKCGQDINLIIKIRTTLNLPNLAVSVGINSLSDTRVCVLHSSIAGYNLALTPGTLVIVCRVPNFSLTSGSYILDVKIISGNDLLLWAPRIANFVVEMGDFYATGRFPDSSWGGIFLLQQKWDINDAAL
ncbi:MAG: hypothetical protein RLZZ419_1728 [Pseudomonadota bacterium]|jgi:lipopolysaccharide transport system ATP-binding protein